MFAAEDRGELPKGTARRWAKETPNMKKLPDKVEKKASFMKAASDGRFFEQMPGRTDATFYKSDFSPEPEQISVTPTGSPMSGMGFRGAGMGEIEKAAKPRPDDNPFDVFAGSDLIVGQHRPTETQPEELEPGAQRFLSEEARSVSYGVGTGIQSGVFSERAINYPALATNNMGKNAADVDAYLQATTSVHNKTASSSPFQVSGGITDPQRWRDIGERAGQTASRVGQKASRSAADLVEGVASNPLLLGAAGLYGLHKGVRGLKGLGRLGLKAGKAALGIKTPPPPPKKSVLQAARRLFSGGN